MSPREVGFRFLLLYSIEIEGWYGMLLFGTRWTTTTLGQLMLFCTQHQQQCMHSAQVRKGWFTLFFIPIIPLGRKYFVVCNICGLRRQAVGTLYTQLQQWEKTGQFPAGESLVPAGLAGAAPPPPPPPMG